MDTLLHSKDVFNFGYHCNIHTHAINIDYFLFRKENRENYPCICVYTDRKTVIFKCIFEKERRISKAFI